MSAKKKTQYSDALKKMLAEEVSKGIIYTAPLDKKGYRELEHRTNHSDRPTLTTSQLNHLIDIALDNKDYKWAKALLFRRETA